MLKFDKYELKKHLNKIADTSKNIAKKTVELGAEGGAFVNKKLEQYSQQSQKAENSDCTVSEIKHMEKYAALINDDLTEIEKKDILKIVLCYEFVLAYNNIREEYIDNDSAGDWESYLNENYLYKYIVSVCDTTINERVNEIINLREIYFNRYQNIIDKQKNTLQQLIKSNISNKEFMMISLEILILSGIVSSDINYESKGKYLAKKVAKGTAKLVAGAVLSAEESRNRQVESELRRVGKNVDNMNEDTLNCYNEMLDDLDRRKENQQMLSASFEEWKNSTISSVGVSKLFNMDINKIKELKIKANL